MKASDLFLETLRSRGGHSVITCPHGLTFFDDEGSFFERGELEDLRAKAAVDRDKYKPLDHEPGSVHYAGHLWIVDCDLCLDGLGRYEAFLWGNREQIGEFMAAKARELIADADSARMVATAVKGTL